MPTVTSRGAQAELLAATTTGTGTALAISPVCTRHAVTIVGAGTISAGIIVVEEANTNDYAGTWSVLFTVVGTTLTGGAQLVTHIEGLIENIRARISTNVTGSGGSLAATIKSY
jgi:hypothetical protein